MARITRIMVVALAALAIGAPIATAMPTDAGKAAPAKTGATHTSGCPAATRAVHGPAGTGCTTSPPNDTELGVAALALTGAAGAFAIVLSTGAAAGRRRDRASTTPALSGSSY